MKLLTAIEHVYQHLRVCLSTPSGMWLLPTHPPQENQIKQQEEENTPLLYKLGKPQVTQAPSPQATMCTCMGKNGHSAPSALGNPSPLLPVTGQGAQTG